LDAGCGNGRFTYQVAQTGAEVIGVDLGWGVYSAFDHMRALPNVHIVRGDLFRLSFPASTFDRIFSIGVLQHTGNAAAAFDAIVRTLRPGGLVAVRVYGKGRRTYEILDRLIRGITIRLPIPMQMAFAGSTAATARWLTSGRWRRRVYKRVLSHVNLLPTKHEMFDWWAAPIATHHTLSEVQSWFTKNHMEILRTRPPLDDANAQRQWLYTHYPINVLGRSSPVALHVFQER
jgi:SAM-dependent methyltransferase